MSMPLGALGMDDPRVRKLRPDKFGVGRIAPRLQADKLVEKPQGTWIRMKTWTHGDPVRSAGPANDIWFQGVDRLWYWSGAFTNPEPWDAADVPEHNQPSYEDLMATFTAMEQQKPLQTYRSERIGDTEITRTGDNRIHYLLESQVGIPVSRPETFTRLDEQKPTYSRYLQDVNTRVNDLAKRAADSYHSYTGAPEPFDYGYTVDMHHRFGWLVRVGVQTWWRLTEKSAHRKGSSEALKALYEQERAESFEDRRLDTRTQYERTQDELEAFDKMLNS